MLQISWPFPLQLFQIFRFAGFPAFCTTLREVAFAVLQLLRLALPSLVRTLSSFSSSIILNKQQFI